jgi:hypothetical protein
LSFSLAWTGLRRNRCSQTQETLLQRHWRKEKRLPWPPADLVDNKREFVELALQEDANPHDAALRIVFPPAQPVKR